jgi:hypothetical protein
MQLKPMMSEVSLPQRPPRQRLRSSRHGDWNLVPSLRTRVRGSSRCLRCFTGLMYEVSRVAKIFPFFSQLDLCQVVCFHRIECVNSKDDA